MGLSEEMRTYLRAVVWDVWIGHPMGDPATVYPGTLNTCDAIVEALAAALLPSGTIPVPAAEVAALREFAAASLALDKLCEQTERSDIQGDGATFPEWPDAIKRWRQAKTALFPSGRGAGAEGAS